MCSLDFNDSINWNVQGCFDQSLVLTGNDFGKNYHLKKNRMMTHTRHYMINRFSICYPESE